MNKRSIYTTEEFNRMFDALYSTIGVRMEFEDKGEFLWIDQGNFLAICKKLLDHLELPVALQPQFTSQFATRAMVQNEAGTSSGIAAQVTTPPNIPWYRSPEMAGFPISITIDPEALGNPYVVLTQLSHEFSHIYLHSRRDPQLESEHATDLCALMMGFTPFWAEGRKTTSSDGLRTITTTQGYLCDEEYAAACRRIFAIRREFKKLRDEIKTLLPDIQSMKSRLESNLAELAQLVDFHYRHPQEALADPSDAEVFAEQVQPYFREEKAALIARALEQTNTIVRALNRKRDFFEADKAWLTGLSAQLKTVGESLRQADIEVTRRVRVVSRNIDPRKYEPPFKKSVADIQAGLADIGALCSAIVARSAQIGRACAVHAGHAKKGAPSPGESQALRRAGDAAVLRSIDDAVKQARAMVDAVNGELDGRKFYSITEQRLAELKQSTVDRKEALARVADEQTATLAALKRRMTLAGRVLLFCRQLTAKE